MKNKILLSSLDISGNEIDYINKAFHRNELSSYGQNLNSLEGNFEKYFNNQVKVACLISGTSALHLALILSGVKKDDEVICQSMTFSASANPIIYQGAKPIFIDSESETWNICPLVLERAIKDRIAKNKKPKAIIVVHLYGMPAKMAEISHVAKKYDITLIEDAAESLGSTYKNQKCGTFGEFGILSFNGNKIITTSGGGALICKNEEDKKKAVFLATQAKDEAPHYQHSEIGYNYRMSNIIAGIGRGQMEVLEKHIGLRRKNNQFYKELFEDVEGIELLEEPSSDFFSNHWLSCILIDDSKTTFNREDLRLSLLADNIESRPLWKPMHLQPVFKSCLYYGANTAEELFRKGLCLPSGSNLTDEDRERIKLVIQKFINKYKK